MPRESTLIARGLPQPYQVHFYGGQIFVASLRAITRLPAGGGEAEPVLGDENVTWRMGFGACGRWLYSAVTTEDGGSQICSVDLEDGAVRVLQGNVERPGSFCVHDKGAAWTTGSLDEPGAQAIHFERHDEEEARRVTADVDDVRLVAAFEDLVLGHRDDALLEWRPGDNGWSTVADDVRLNIWDGQALVRGSTAYIPLVGGVGRYDASESRYENVTTIDYTPSTFCTDGRVLYTHKSRDVVVSEIRLADGHVQDFYVHDEEVKGITFGGGRLYFTTPNDDDTDDDGPLLGDVRAVEV